MHAVVAGAGVGADILAEQRLGLEGRDDDLRDRPVGSLHVPPLLDPEGEHDGLARLREPVDVVDVHEDRRQFVPEQRDVGGDHPVELAAHHGEAELAEVEGVGADVVDQREVGRRHLGPQPRELEILPGEKDPLAGVLGGDPLLLRLVLGRLHLPGAGLARADLLELRLVPSLRLSLLRRRPLVGRVLLCDAVGHHRGAVEAAAVEVEQGLEPAVVGLEPDAPDLAGRTERRLGLVRHPVAVVRRAQRRQAEVVRVGRRAIVGRPLVDDVVVDHRRVPEQREHLAIDRGDLELVGGEGVARGGERQGRRDERRQRR